MFGKIRDTYRQAYSGLPRKAWILFTVNLVNSSGSMVIFFLTLYLTRKLGFSPVRAGGTLSLYGIGSLLGAYGGGWLADKVGSIVVQKAGLALAGGFLIALGQVRQPPVLFPLLFLFAVAAGSLYPVNSTSMARICPPDLQVKGFALNRLANNLGVTIGPAVGGLLALRDYRLLFWADGLTSLAAAVVFALMWKGSGKEPRAAEDGSPAGAGPRSARPGISDVSRPRPADRSPWRDGPFLLLMLLFIVWCSIFIQVLTTFPLYMRDVYGLAENHIGQLLAVNTVMIVVLEMVLMEKIRKYPLTRMINISFVLIGAGLGLLPLGRGFAFAAFTVAVWTFGEMLSMPLVTALIAGRAVDATRGRYMGIFSFVFSLAFIIAPPAGTAVYGRFGGNALWFGCAATGFALAGAFSLLRPALDKPVRIG
ncbi:MAG: MFS transporter [Candidatus Aminicenantales bacterium]|jgi:predicted MFS family arabinose efflux permease